MGVVRVAAIGAVDDGKSTLIGRLLADTGHLRKDQLEAIAKASSRRGREGIDLAFVTDGLRAERDQGITVDVAYRFLTTDRNRVIIADCPGHAQYTANAATGASTADVAVVLVDVTRGMRPQTRRHMVFASLFGVRRMIVVANKMDLVGWSEQALLDVQRQAEVLASRMGVPELVVIPISALAGDNVVTRSQAASFYNGPSVLEAIEEPLPALAESSGARFPVQSSVRTGNGRSYLGSVSGGTLRKGDEVTCLPSGLSTVVDAIETYEGLISEAGPGRAVAIRLVDEIDLQRGDMLVPAGSPPTLTTSLDGILVWFAERPLRAGSRYRVKHGTRTTPVMVSEVTDKVDLDEVSLSPAGRDAELGQHELGRVRLVAATPLPVDNYKSNRFTGSFILIDEVSRSTVAAGLLGVAIPAA